MKLINLQMTNFMPFKSAKVKFQGGITQIIGRNYADKNAYSNGAGKSAIMEAIIWCLFGKTLRDMGTNDVITFGEKMAKVELELEHNGKIIKIERIKKYGETSKVKGLEQIGELDFSLFRLGAVFDKDSVSFVSAPAGEKQRILSKFIGGDIIDNAGKLAKEKLSELKTGLSNCEQELFKLQVAMESYTRNEEEYKKELDQLEQEIKCLNDEIMVLKKNLIEKNSQEDTKIIEGKLKEIEKELKQISNEATTIKANIDNKKKEIKELEGQKITIENMTGRCPTCLRPITPEGQKESLNIVNNRIISSQKEMEELNDILLSLDNEYNDKIKNLQKLEKTLENVKKKEQELMLIKAKLGNLETKQSTISLNKEKLVQKLEKIAQEKQKIQKQIKELEKQKETIEKQVEIYEFLKKSFGSGGFRVWRIKRIIEALNRMLETIELSDTITRFIVVENPQGEIMKIDLEVSKNGHIVNYETLSGGERRKVIVEVLLALNKLLQGFGEDIKVLICDEIFDTLVYVGINAIADIINEIGSKNQVVIISHNEELENVDWHKILVRKTKEDTIIEEVQ